VVFFLHTDEDEGFGAARTAIEDPLTGLRAALQETTDEGSLRERLLALAPALGFALGEQRGRLGGPLFRLTLRQPVPARRLCQVMGWERAYATSGDAHLSMWHIGLWSGDLDRWGGPRIATHFPHVGAWSVRPRLDGRPKGDLPGLASGGASAYDLRTYPASVASIDIEPWDPRVQGPETIEIPKTATAPQYAASRAVIKGWVESVKGLGAPQFAEAELPDMRVFVAWNIPTSGLNETYYWIYCLGIAGWKLKQSSSFLPSRDQVHSAAVDAAEKEVRFLGAGGKIERRVPIGMCKWSPLLRPQW
jgi:hypothetical protein